MISNNLNKFSVTVYIKLTKNILWSLLQSFLNSEVIDLRLHKSSFRLQLFFSHRPTTKHAHHGLVMWRHGQESRKKCQNNWYIYKLWLWSFKTAVFDTTYVIEIQGVPPCILLGFLYIEQTEICEIHLSWIYFNLEGVSCIRDIHYSLPLIPLTDLFATWRQNGDIHISWVFYSRNSM